MEFASLFAAVSAHIHHHEEKDISKAFSPKELFNPHPRDVEQRRPQYPEHFQGCWIRNHLMVPIH